MRAATGLGLVLDLPGNGTSTSSPLECRTVRPMSETVHLTHTGSPRTAAMLADLLEKEGIEVSWERPVERRDAAAAAEAVAIFLTCRMAEAGGKAALRAAVAKVRERWPRTKTEDDRGYL